MSSSINVTVDGKERTILADVNEHGWYRLELDAATVGHIMAGLHYATLGQATPVTAREQLGRIHHAVESVLEDLDATAADVPAESIADAIRTHMTP